MFTPSPTAEATDPTETAPPAGDSERRAADHSAERQI